MKHLKRTLQLFVPLLLLAAVGCLLVLWLAGREDKTRREILSSMGYLGDTTGFWVTTGLDTWRDFPHEDGLSREELTARLDEMVELAETARFNTIYFQARSDGAAFYQSRYADPHPSLSGAKGALGAFDPLDYLCTAGLEKRIQVYAILDLEEPDLSRAEEVEKLAALVGELGKNYPVGGILLAGLDQAPGEAVETALRAAKARLDKDAPGTPLGLLFHGDSVTPELVAGLTEDRTIEVVVPRLNQNVTDGSFFEALRRWTDAAAPTAKVLPALKIYYEGPAEEQQEMELRLLAASMEEGASGAVLEYYSQMKQDRRWAERAVGLLNTPKGPAPDLDFDIPRTLAVTYPAGDVSVTDSAIFLMGTSDPGQPLTLDGEEIERTTAGGTWGSLQKLEMGSNVFTLRQGEAAQTVTVRRYTLGPAAPIEGIAEGSLFPRYSCGVDSDEKLLLSCIGPAGGSITATLGERSIQLNQEGSGSQGAPVAYRGTLELDPADYDPNTTAKIGPVSYLLSYNGVTTTYQSQGEVYVAGRNVRLAVENTAQLSAVLTDPDDDETITGSLKAGAKAYVEETVRTSRGGAITLAYKIQGGYILAGTPGSGEMARVLEGDPHIALEMGEMATTLDESGSLTVDLGEGTPAITTRRTGEALILDCLDTTVTGALSQLSNGFVQLASSEEIPGGTRVTLQLEPEGGLWGYDLYYQDGRTRLYLKAAPKLSDSFGKPLEGVTVMLDPGHGGSDPGAMGVAGESGPAEAQLNLAVSQAVKYRLEQLGAAVTLTRSGDSKVSLYERVDMAAAARPDVFLSIHHNSGVLTGNMNQARRMECYYFEDLSEPFARKLMEKLPGAVGRPGTEAEQARYYVTRQTGNPAVLLEVGFMVNPLEYEECMGKATIVKTACGIAEVIEELVAAAG